MYILPEDQYKGARTRLGGIGDNADAFTDQNPNSSLSGLFDRFRSPSLRGVVQSAQSGSPTMVFNRDNPESMNAMGHEVAHSIAGHGAPPPPNQVLAALAKYSPLGQANLEKMKYNEPSQQASEVIARLMSPSQTYGMGVSEQDAPKLFQDYLKLVSDPKMRAQYQADWLTKHPQRIDPTQRNTDVNQQPPSSVF